MKCKVSGKKITPFMSFGKMPMANGFLEQQEFNNEFFYELEVGFSEDNFLFQVNDHPKSNKIFNDKYPFYTHKSNYMVSHFKDYYSWIKKKFIKTNSKILEIGSNDGTFLKNYLYMIRYNSLKKYKLIKKVTSIILTNKENNIIIITFNSIIMYDLKKKKIIKTLHKSNFINERFNDSFILSDEKILISSMDNFEKKK